MKTARKVLAALLVVLMVAVMVPFAASAETTYSYSFTVKGGFTYNVYKIASIDENGQATDLTGGKITASNLTPIDCAALLTEAETMDVTGLTLDKTLDLSSSDSTTTGTLENTDAAKGVYYVRITGDSTTTKHAGSVFSLPYNDNGTEKTSITKDLTSKAQNGDYSVTKSFADDESAAYKTANVGDTINFVLTASVTGSTDNKATSWKLYDEMLGLENASVSKVTLTGGNGVADKELVQGTDYTVSTTTNGFYVEMASSVLSGTEFYSYTTVKVECSAQVAESANKGVVSVKTGKTIDETQDTDNYNLDKLEYATTSYTTATTIPGQEVEVYTFDVKVTKTDAYDNTKTLSGAGFTLYSDANCTTEVKSEQTTDNNGVTTFEGLAAGTYYLKETTAPTGYNIYDSVITVNVGADIADETAGTIEVSVVDYPLGVPSTGGTGTMVFTIVGLSLIACAGVLFLVVKKRRAAK